MSRDVSAKRRSNLVIHLILIAGSVVMVLPFLWMILTSLKTTTEATQIPITLFPAEPSLRGYTDALRQSPFMHYYANTLISAFMKTVFPVIFSAMAAFAFARIRFPGSGLCFF